MFICQQRRNRNSPVSPRGNTASPQYLCKTVREAIVTAGYWRNDLIGLDALLSCTLRGHLKIDTETCHNIHHCVWCREHSTMLHVSISVRARGAAAPRLGQSHYFSGRSQQLKMKNKFLYLLNEKTELIPSSEKKCPKSGIFTITGWGESGKAIVQVSIAVFSGAVKKSFGQRWLSPLRKKLARTPMYVSNPTN